MNRPRFSVFKVPTLHSDWQLNITFMFPVTRCHQKHKSIRGSAAYHLLDSQGLQMAPKGGGCLQRLDF